MTTLFIKHIKQTIKVIPAKGKTGGYRIKLVVANKTAPAVELTHELLFEEEATALTVAARVRMSGTIKLAHWHYKACADACIKGLAQAPTGRLKTQLYKKVEY